MVERTESGFFRKPKLPYQIANSRITDENGKELTQSEIADIVLRCPHCGAPMQRTIERYETLEGGRWVDHSGTEKEISEEARYYCDEDCSDFPDEFLDKLIQIRS